jgi:anti-anti-sigma factor
LRRPNCDQARADNRLLCRNPDKVRVGNPDFALPAIAPQTFREPYTSAMPQEFEVDVDSGSGRATVRVSGEFDLAATEAVENALLSVENGANSEIVLDLREVTFLDSTGLRTITSADHRARGSGRVLKVVRGPEQVQKLLYVTGMDKILPLVDDPDEPVENR